MKLLITFGCSWTVGVGLNYEPGMSREEFVSDAWDSDLLNRYSFRGLLCQDYNMHNLNFSKGGSSNQEQFRLAEDFFSSTDFKICQEKYSEITVLWGITSILRNEAYFTKLKKRKSFFYTDNSELSKITVVNHFDSQHELALLTKKICFWNNFFDAIGITNLWFDTFNHHDYAFEIPEHIQDQYQQYAGHQWPTWHQFVTGNFEDVELEVQKEILDQQNWEFYKYFHQVPERMLSGHTCPRDLLSQLALQSGMTDLDNNYHISSWGIDSNRISHLVSLGLINPYSYHPTKAGHSRIANMLSGYYNT